jgi:hypothetical protein
MQDFRAGPGRNQLQKLPLIIGNSSLFCGEPAVYVERVPGDVR